MEIIKRQADSYQIQGLSPVSFCVGVMNVGISGYMIGANPEYFWLYIVSKMLVVFTLLFFIRKKKKHLMYFYDFCWINAFAWIILNLQFLFTHWGLTKSVLPEFTLSGKMYLLTFGIANGPIAWACLALGNAMLFHRVDHMASLFIHLSPCLVSWSIRWN